MNQHTADKLSTLTNEIHVASPLDTSAMLENYLKYVQRALKASSVSWIAGYRGQHTDDSWRVELLDGWKIMDQVTPGKSAQDLKANEAEYYEKARAAGVDPMTQHAIHNAGKTRTHREAELDAVLSEHWIKSEFLAKLGVGDRVLGVFNLDAEAESYLVVDRSPFDEPFTRDDERELYRCLIEFPRVHYWLFLERGLLARNKKPCSPRHRDLIPLLLSGKTEREIANQLDLTVGTTHSYVIDIYRNYGVKSRAELSSLWISKIQ